MRAIVIYRMNLWFNVDSIYPCTFTSRLCSIHLKGVTGFMQRIADPKGQIYLKCARKMCRMLLKNESEGFASKFICPQTVYLVTALCWCTHHSNGVKSSTNAFSNDSFWRLTVLTMSNNFHITIKAHTHTYLFACNNSTVVVSLFHMLWHADQARVSHLHAKINVEHMFS